MSEPWIAPGRPELVWFGGADALRFLNDLISQEIGDLADGEARRSFLLEPQGKLRFLLWVVRDGDRYGLVTEEGRGEELATALGRYRIRVDVAITREERETTIVVGDWDGGANRGRVSPPSGGSTGEAGEGGEPPPAPSAPPPPTSPSAPGGGNSRFAYDIGWPGVPRLLVVGGRPDLPEGDEEEYDRLRILAGEPRWGADVDEGTIPHESGLVPVSVDFTKGCFLGQELVARVDSRGGNTPRHLRFLRTDGELTVGDTVTMGDEEVGSVTSAAGGTGLAMLKRVVSVGDSVEVGDVTARVDDLPPKTAG